MNRIVAGAEELPRLMTATVEEVFHGRLGICSPRLTDYLARLLLHFVRMNAIFSVRNSVGQRLCQVHDMLAEAEERSGRRRVETHRHIGDFVLFWVGYYPEALRDLKRWDQPDALIDYRQYGRRSYEIFAREAHDDPVAEACWQLSEDFDACAYGLHRVRQALTH